jgi:hypothetical protein
MTASGLLDDLLKIADKNANDTEYRALGLIWLKQILADISNRQQNFHWRFLEDGTTFSTAINDFDYDLATIAASIDTTKVIHVYDKTNDRTYRYVPYEVFRQFVADETNSSGETNIFSIFAGDLLLWPVPSAVITTNFDYVKIIPTPTDGSTVLLIPDKYENVVMDGLMAKAYKFDPELGDARVQFDLYENGPKNGFGISTGGVQGMIKDNNPVIAENKVPVSHRSKLRGHAIDHKNSLFFPLAGTNF